MQILYSINDLFLSEFCEFIWQCGCDAGELATARASAKAGTIMVRLLAKSEIMAPLMTFFSPKQYVLKNNEKKKKHVVTRSVMDLLTLCRRSPHGLPAAWKRLHPWALASASSSSMSTRTEMLSPSLCAGPRGLALML